MAEAKNQDGNCPCCRGPYLREKVDITTKEIDEGNANEEQADDNNVHTTDEESNPGSETPDNVNNAQTSEESDANEDQPNVDPNVVQTTDECNQVDCELPSLLLEQAKSVSGAEFTSFCIVHGLKLDKKWGSILSIKPILDEPTEVEDV